VNLAPSLQPSAPDFGTLGRSDRAWCLGKGELAKQALTRGLAVFADDLPEWDRIVAPAALGLSQ
jgi:hypothetical protein